MKIKKIAAWLTALAMSVTALATPLSENFSGILDGLFDKISYSAGAETYGDYEYTEFDDGTVHITKYNGTDEIIAIPSEINGKTVVTIGESAFDSCTSPTSIIIPDGVKRIGEFAFYNCSNLASVTIPESLTIIDKYAFNSCSNLASITIPDGVTNVGEYAFNGTAILDNQTADIKYIDNWLIDCSEEVTSVTVKSGTKGIAGCAFKNCSSLTGVTIPDGVTSIGDSAFEGCYSITGVAIPDSVTNIGYSAFEGCSGLTEVTIPDGVTSIEAWTFKGNSSLAEVTIPDSVTNIDDSAFYGCSDLTSVTLPDNVTYIGAEAFYGCANLVEINIPDGLIGIGQKAFYNCSSLTGSIIIPEGVASIYDSTFFGCSSLKSITLPDELTTIGGWAFQNCTGLTSMTIPETVTSIGNSAFQNCSGIESINIPDGITLIGNYLFSYCSSLKSITIPDSVVEIGDNSFYGCSGLTEIIIPESVQKIRNRAFFGCSGLVAVTVPKNLTDLANDVFSNCSGLTSINVSAENSKYSSEDGALYDKNKATLVCCPAGKTSITFPSTIATIGDYAFYGCSKLTSLTIPDTVLTIGNYVFWNCSELESIAIPDSVTSIGDYVFYGCTGLKSVTFPEAIEKIGDNVFAYCTGLETVTIPDSVTSIGNSAFWSCTGLETIIIPDGVISIGNAAFCGDTNLTSITIPDSVTTFGFGVFDGCSNLTIKCNSGSAAYQYAVANSINYTLLDANPASVTGLKMTANNAGSISMSWNKVTGATGYVVYQAINGKWEKIKVTSGNTLTVSGLNAGTDYKFTVKAYKTIGETNYYSPSYTGVWMTTAPANVTDLKMNANNVGLISMSWTKVPNATGYVVYQAIDGKWVRIKTTTSNTLNVTGLKAGTSYKFTVKAYKTFEGTNYYSPSYTGVWMTTLPAKPSAKMTVNTPQAIRLEWGKVTGASGYVIYQQVNGSWVQKATTTNNVYVATGLKSGTNYNFAVRAYRTFNGKNYYSPFVTSTDTIKTCTKPATVNFTLTAGTKKATVNWSKVTGATGYIVYYKTSANGSWQKLTTTSGTTFTKTGLTSGKTYYFTVKAYKTYSGKTYNASFITRSIKVK